MAFRGAGGSPGGVGSFLLGFLMMCAGGYLLLRSIIVSTVWGFSVGLFQFSAFGSPLSISGGMLLVPLIIGIAMVFYQARNWTGWLLVAGSLVALIVGVLANLRFSFQHMTLFDLLGILVLCFGGLGLFLRSLRPASRPEQPTSPGRESDS